MCSTIAAYALVTTIKSSGENVKLIILKKKTVTKTKNYEIMTYCILRHKCISSVIIRPTKKTTVFFCNVIIIVMNTNDNNYIIYLIRVPIVYYLDIFSRK